MNAPPTPPPLPTPEMLGVDPEPLGLRAEVLLGRLESPAVACRE